MRSLQRSLTFRASRRALPNLPLSVRSTGHYRVGGGWRDTPVQKWFAEIFWIIEGHGTFGLADRVERVGPGQIFVYRPGDIHQLTATTTVWEYYWVTLDHPDIGHWLDGFGLERRIHSPGLCPRRLFHQLTACLKDCTPHGERQSAQIAHAILLAASSRLEEPDAASIGTRARNLIDAHYEKAEWSIGMLPGQLNVHRTTLLRGFLKDYGMPPSRYLQNRRIQKALALLRSSELRIQEIAWEAGFSDPNYFARAIHQATGMTPRQFRRQ